MTSQRIKSIANTALVGALTLCLISSMFIGFLAVGTQPVAAQESSPTNEWTNGSLPESDMLTSVMTDSGDYIQLREDPSTDTVSIVKLDGSTGDVLFSKPSWSGTAHDSLLYDKFTDTVAFKYTDSNGGHLIGVDATTGEQKWNRATDNVYFSSAGTDGYGYFSSDATISKVDMSTGDVVWENTLSTTIYRDSILLPSSENLYVGLDDGSLHSLNTETGDTKWSDNIHSSKVTATGYENGNIYAKGGTGDTIIKYDAIDNQVEWKNGSYTDSLGSGLGMALWPEQDTLIHEARNSDTGEEYYKLIDTSTGDEVGEITRSNASVSHVMVLDDSIITAANSTIYKHDSSGTLISSHDTGVSGDISGTLLAQNDKVYAGTQTSQEAVAVSGMVSTEYESWTQRGGDGTRTFAYLTQNAINIQVTDSNGAPVPDAKVKAWGVNSNIVSDTSSYLSGLTDVKPDNWDSNLDVETDVASTVDGTYAIASEKDMRAWDYLDDADLTPKVRHDEGSVVLTRWDATESSGMLGGYVDGQYDGQNLGTVQDSGSVTVERIDHKGEVVQEMEVQMDKTIGDGGLNPIGKSLTYGEAHLTSGFYRVYPTDNPAASYVIVVGNADEIANQIRDDLKNDANELTQASKNVQDATDAGELREYTAITGSDGTAKITVDESVNVVSVQGHKAPDALQLPDSASLSEIESASSEQSFDGSVYVSTRPQRVEVPSEVEVNVIGIGAQGLPGSDLTQYQDWINQAIEDSMSESLSDIRTYIDSENANVEEELQAVVEQNDELRTRLEEIREQQSISEDDTAAQIEALQESITSMQDTLDAGESTKEVSDNAVDIDVPFTTGILGDGISKSDVVVVAQKSDGTEEVVSDEYYSVSSGVRSNTVEVRDYPFSEGLTTFRVIAANEEKHGEETVRVGHPSSSPPSLNGVELSTMTPGPSDTVRLTADTDGEIVGVNVEKPNGNAGTAEVVRTDAVDFQTDGAGVHTVDVQIRGEDGVDYTETMRVKAGSDASRDKPQISLNSGKLGTYPVTAGGVQADSIDVSGDGVEIDAIVSSDANGRVHIYANEVDASSDSVTVNLLDEGKQPLGEHRTVILHTSKLSEDALVEKDGGPIHPETQFGTQIDNKDATVFETYTGETGSVTLEMNNDPGPIESAMHTVSVKYHQYIGGSGFSIPFLSMMPPLEPPTIPFPSLEPPAFPVPSF